MKFHPIRNLAVVMFLGIVFSTSVFAQQRLFGLEVSGEIPDTPMTIGRVPEPSWGTTQEIISHYSALNFTAAHSDIAYSNDQGVLYRFAGGALNPWFDQNLNLPDGAEITHLELEGCDQSSTAQLAAAIIRYDSPMSPGFAIVGVLFTGETEVPGCQFFGVPITSPARFVDNFNGSLSLRLEIGGEDFNTRVRAVRVRYRLRVSPPPATATFADVPTTHPLFQFVEALAASGITAGCDADNFCPNAPLTRGQMAVFLAKALGLHWPN